MRDERTLHQTVAQTKDPTTMKKLLFAMTSALSLLTASAAFAALPICSDSTPRGAVCQASPTDGTVRTSCGGGVFLPGRVTNAGNLEDGCFNASRAANNNGAAQTAKDTKQVKSMSPSPTKPKGGKEVRQPDAGSEGAEVGEEGSSGSSGSKP